MAHRKSNPTSTSLSALSLWLGFWQALVKEILSLGGNDDTLRRVISDAAWRKKLAAFIVDAAENVVAKELTFLRTITLPSGGISKDELLRRISVRGDEVSSWARDIMGKPAFTTSPQPTTIKLGWITVGGLGFTEPPTTTELFARIKEVGALCPAEAGPHLRLADQNQPNGTVYWIMMEPISDSDGHPNVFGVGRHGDGKRWLNASYAIPDDRWNLDIIVVLSLRT